MSTLCQLVLLQSHRASTVEDQITKYCSRRNPSAIAACVNVARPSQTVTRAFAPALQIRTRERDGEVLYMSDFEELAFVITMSFRRPGVSFAYDTRFKHSSLNSVHPFSFPPVLIVFFFLFSKWRITFSRERRRYGTL